MTSDEREALTTRSRRGTPRGADAIFDAASSASASSSSRSPRRGPWLAAAAVIVVLAAAGVWFASSTSDDFDGFAGPGGVAGDLSSATPVDGLGGWLVETFTESTATYRRDALGWTATMDGGGQQGSSFGTPVPFRFHDDAFKVYAELGLGFSGSSAADTMTGWYEIILTTSPVLGPLRDGGAFAVEAAPGHWTLGCRLEPGGNTICDLMDDTGRSAADGGRVWQASFFQEVGTTTFGGFENPDTGLEISRCEVLEPECLDGWTVVFGVDSIRIDLNDRRYFEQTGMPRLPDELTSGDVYVHFATMTSGHPDPQVVFAGRVYQIG